MIEVLEMVHIWTVFLRGLEQYNVVIVSAKFSVALQLCEICMKILSGLYFRN